VDDQFGTHTPQLYERLRLPIHHEILRLVFRGLQLRPFACLRQPFPVGCYFGAHRVEEILVDPFAYLIIDALVTLEVPSMFSSP
jgi:hypothetical protein